MTSSPQGLFQLTGPDAYRVEDADEEVYLLHVRSGENTEGFGVVDSKHDTLCVTLRISSQAGRSCPEDIQVVLHQNCTALRSRAGDTGSVAWRCSTFFAEHMLQQLWGTWPGPSLFHAQSFSACRVLELGAGTGVLPACLFAHPGWLHPSSRPIRWIATDRADNMPLLTKNVGGGRYDHAHAQVSVRELDWLDVQAASGRVLDRLRTDILSAYEGAYPDLILCLDCVYNPALHRPLLSTLHAFCQPQHTAVLLVMQLRDVDNTLEFLTSWLSASWTVYHVPESLLPPPMQTAYVAWVAWRTV